MPCSNKQLESPIFVVGCSRSGTTLLQQMLAAHSDIAIAPETHFIRRFWLKRRRFGDLKRDANYRALIDGILSMPEFADMGIDAEVFRAAAWTEERRYSALFGLLLRLFAEKAAVSNVGEKTPNHLLYMPVLEHFFPSARFLHIVRDPRAVVNSWRNVPWSTGSASGDAMAWRRHLAKARRRPPRNAAQLLVVHYEDVVGRPEVTLRQVCHFLNVPFEPQMTLFHTQSLRGLNVAREPWKLKSTHPLDPARIDQWRAELTGEMVAQIEAVVRGEMMRAGYQPETSRLRSVPLLPAIWAQEAVRRLQRGLRYVFPRRSGGALRSVPTRRDARTAVASMIQAPCARASAGAFRVAMVPYWPGNPYQLQLLRCLSELGVPVTGFGGSARRVGGGLLRSRAKVLHLHWLHPFYEASNVWLATAKLLLSVAGMAALRVAGTRWVWTVHNLRHHEDPYPQLDRIFTRFIACHADAVIVHCPTAAQAVLHLFPQMRRDNVHVVPHGHYMEAYERAVDRFTARKELSLPVDDTVFLFFGQMRPYKGLPDLIDAFKQIDGRDVTLLVAGKPLSQAEEESIRRAAAADQRIRLVLGFIPDREVHMYLSACDAVVLPYRQILTSGAAILAMSFGRAIVAPRLGCLPDWLDDQGAFLYGARTRGALADALRLAMQRRADLEAMGAYNQARVAAWSWQHIAELTVGIYRRAYARRSGLPFRKPAGASWP